ncbi:MAG: hypothetical protein WDA20_09175 [Desulfuromonadales bacterium]
MAAKKMRIPSPIAVAGVLLAIALLLVFASVAGQLTKYWLGHDHVYGLVPLFYLDAERNIPTLFSVLLLLLSAILLFVVTTAKKQERDPDVSKWTILTCGFLLMAADEAFSFHEKLTSPVQRLLGDGPLGVFYFAWVIPGSIVVVVLSIFFLRFLLRLPATTRWTFIVAGILYSGGVFGLELLGGRYMELHGNQNLTYSMIATVEESLEMAGVIVFIYALLNYVHAQRADRNRTPGCTMSAPHSGAVDRQATFPADSHMGVKSDENN